MTQAEAAFNDTGKPARVFKDFRYRTRDSWSCERRVIGKAEFLEKGANPRFVVTSLSPERLDARALYEDFYCARGDMENRIKEQQLDLFADRTSAATMRANQTSALSLLGRLHAYARLAPSGTPEHRSGTRSVRNDPLEAPQDRSSSPPDRSSHLGLHVGSLSLRRHLRPRCSKSTSASSALLTDTGPHIRLASIASAQVCLRASRHAILSPTMRQLTLFDSHKSLTPAPSAPLPS